MSEKEKRPRKTGNSKMDNNGITFSDQIEIKMKSPVNYNIAEQGLQVLMLIFILYGTMYSFIDSFQIPVRKFWLNTAIFLFITIFYLTYTILRRNGKKRLRIYLSAIYIITAAFLVIDYWDEIKEGFYLLENIIIENLNYYFSSSMKGYIAATTGQDVLLTILMISVTAIISLLCVFFVAERAPKILYLLFTMPFVFSPLIVGLVPPLVPFTFYCIGSCGFLFSAELKGKRYKGRRKTEQEIHTASAAGKILMVGGGLLCILFLSLFTKEDYVEKVDVYALKSRVTAAMEDFTNISIKRVIDYGDGDTGGTAHGGLSGGKLGGVDTIEFLNRTALQVIMPKEQITIYLKGYVGETYSKNEWKSLGRKDLKEYETLMEELVSVNFNLQYQSENLIMLLSRQPNAGNKYNLGKILIENMSANDKYEYKPYRQGISDNSGNREEQLKEDTKQNIYPFYYESFYNEGISYIYMDKELDINAYDWGTVTKMPNQNNSNMILYKLQVNEENLQKNYEQIYMEGPIDFSNVAKKSGLSNAMEEASPLTLIADKFQDEYDERLQAFLNLERKYREFVYEHYAVIPEETSSETIGLFKDEMLQSSNMSLNELFELIRTFLNKHTVYSLSPGRVPKGKDFVDYFVMENKQGYCSHYATTAVLLLRSIGVPARYAEGYVITPEDMMEARDVSEDMKLKYYYPVSEQVIQKSIKDTNAHAWAEVYIDAFGWVPVEFTPPYNANSFSIPLMIQHEAERQEQERRDQIAKDFNSPQNSGDSVSAIADAKELQEERKRQEEEKRQEAMTGKKPDSGKESTKSSGVQIMDTYFVFSETFIRIVKLIAVLMLFIAATVLFLFIRLLYRNYRFNKAMNSDDNQKKVIFIYGDMLRFLSHYHVLKPSDVSYDKYAKYIEDELYFVNEGEFGPVLKTVLKARFSNGSVNNDELVEVQMFYLKLQKQIYKRVNKRDWFYYKYLRCY